MLAFGEKFLLYPTPESRPHITPRSAYLVGVLGIGPMSCLTKGGVQGIHGSMSADASIQEEGEEGRDGSKDLVYRSTLG